LFTSRQLVIEPAADDFAPHPAVEGCKNHFDRKKENGKGTMIFICEGQRQSSQA
jgi:hypothetical protein